MTNFSMGIGPAVEGAWRRAAPRLAAEGDGCAAVGGGAGGALAVSGGVGAAASNG
jgi:hypothetical protein